MATTTVTPKLGRTEEEICGMLPIKARLGAETYEIKPLAVIPQRAWRERLTGEVQSIGEVLNPTADNMPVFLRGLAFIFLQFPEKIAELIFAYAPDLPREKVLQAATEEQLGRVFSQIVQVAFPFVTELTAITQTLGLATSFPQLVKPTK